MSLFAPLVLPDPDRDSSSANQKRRDSRNNLFVVAALLSESAAGPVRIRNISPAGALVEGGALPAAGEPMQLSRGSLSVAGRVVWRAGDRAGIKFASMVSVSEWLPAGRGPMGQQRIDEIVHRYKGGSLPATPSTAVAWAAGADVAVALAELGLSINAAAEELASDPSIAKRYAEALQAIDVAAQRLDQIANQLAAPAP